MSTVEASYVRVCVRREDRLGRMFPVSLASLGMGAP